MTEIKESGIETHYKYDAAGRMIKEGDKTYTYAWLDKVVNVAENGKTLASFEYQNKGQISKAIRDSGIETFAWDGLALIERNGVAYINEPHAGGGNPILATSAGVLSGAENAESQSISYATQNASLIFTDILGTSLGEVNASGDGTYSAIDKTAFGSDSNNTNSFFTGKPHIAELGYAFLFRNYNANIGKWQTSDPLGYFDGLNIYSYCSNRYTMMVDLLGAAGTLTIHSSATGEGSSTNTSGHSWIEYTPDPTPQNPNPNSTTYGTWGNKDPVGLHENLEKNYNYDDQATRSSHLNDSQEQALMDKINEYRDAGEDGWGLLENCSGFAADAWDAATGEDLSGTLWTTPSTLKDNIIEKNGGKSHGVKE